MISSGPYVMLEPTSRTVASCKMLVSDKILLEGCVPEVKACAA